MQQLQVNFKDLERKAWQIRLELVRMFGIGQAHHFGGSLSVVELVTALYFYKMRYSAERMNDPTRDRFIMSKGHSVPAQYVALSMLGIIPREELKTIKRLGTRLQGHPDLKKTPGLEAPTGSLGQGLSFASGIALAARLDGLKFNIYVVLGDGELQEGQVWEAAMSVAHYKLTNICVLIDRNRFQSQNSTDRTMGIEPLENKWRSFGWDTRRADGHDLPQVCAALDQFGDRNPRPFAIIADTVKGKGISWLENTFEYHNAALSEEQSRRAEEEIQKKLGSLG